MSIGRALLEPGWRWSTSIGEVIGESSCQVHHISLVLAGRIGFEMDSGETAEIGPEHAVRGAARSRCVGHRRRDRW